MAEKVFTAVIERSGAVGVREAEIVKETPQYYVIRRIAPDDDWVGRSAFGYSSRVPKERFATTASDAVRRYIDKRTKDRENAAAVIRQAADQIGSAYELLNVLEPPQAEAAVDPVVAS